MHKVNYALCSICRLWFLSYATWRWLNICPLCLYRITLTQW